MNTQNEKGVKQPSRHYHRPEQKQAPHRRPPSSKEAVPSVPARQQNKVRGRKPLPVARPMRPRTGSAARRRKDTDATRPGVAATQSRSQPRRMLFDVRTVFTIVGFAVAAVLVILFGFDLAMAVPFEQVSLLMDVTYLFCGIILGWLSWSCFRDLR